MSVETVRGYKTDNPQQEFYQHIEQRLAKVARLDHDLDRCTADSALRKLHALIMTWIVALRMIARAMIQQLPGSG